MKKIRKKIDLIDRKIKKNLEKRFKLTDEIGVTKNNLKEDFFVSEREKNVFQNVSSKRKEVSKIYKSIVNESLKNQVDQNLPKAVLIGNDISYSLSPFIHGELSKILGIPYQYEILDINKEDIENYINKIKNHKIIFANITKPYKEEVIKFLDILEKNVYLTRSTNLIMLNSHRKLIGYNTDYYGLKELFSDFKFEKDVEVYILGTGPSARVVYEYLFNNYNIVSNFVTRDKTNSGVNDKKLLTYEELENSVLKKYVLINATPLGMGDKKDLSLVSQKTASSAIMLFDLNYNPVVNKFLSYNKNHRNGIGMLVSQALYSIKIYFDLELDEKPEEEIIKEVVVKLYAEKL